MHAANVITVQTCKECGHLANVAISCSKWACIACTRIQDTEYSPSDLTQRLTSLTARPH